jgi:hypothetical protein
MRDSFSLPPSSLLSFALDKILSLFTFTFRALPFACNYVLGEVRLIFFEYMYILRGLMVMSDVRWKLKSKKIKIGGKSYDAD